MNAIVFFILTTSVCIHASPVENDWRVVGGHTAENGSVPYQVSLRTSDNLKHYCGGSIIASKTILTGGHCLYDKNADDVFVIVGTNQLLAGGIRHESRTLILYPKYNPDDNHHNDLGIIILKNSIDFQPTVQSISLDKNIIIGPVDVTISGWSVGNLGPPPNDLYTANLKTITNAECSIAQSQTIYDSDICTFTPATGPCQGDTGGALVANGKQIGIVSRGIGCGKGYPDVHARISSFYQWIDAYTED